MGVITEIKLHGNKIIYLSITLSIIINIDNLPAIIESCYLLKNKYNDLLHSKTFLPLINFITWINLPILKIKLFYCCLLPFRQKSKKESKKHK